MQGEGNNLNVHRYTYLLHIYTTKRGSRLANTKQKEGERRYIRG